MNSTEKNRSLTASEHALARWMLENGLPEARAFLEQLEKAEVTPWRCPVVAQVLIFRFKAIPLRLPVCTSSATFSAVLWMHRQACLSSKAVACLVGLRFIRWQVMHPPCYPGLRCVHLARTEPAKTQVHIRMQDRFHCPCNHHDVLKAEGGG